MNRVYFNKKELKIQIQSSAGEDLYEIDLKQFSEKPNISHIISEISQQKWCSNETLDSLIKILDKVCAQTDNYCEPGIFCPFGQD